MNPHLRTLLAEYADKKRDAAEEAAKPRRKTPAVPRPAATEAATPADSNPASHKEN